ncbi:WD40 repeat domain-containing protein [Fulvimarina sp. 2208YS6-2-32]|uniref:WD40 repeat domain-containing protein n=1 Tax=Fulvimarina uroteuthidis TaxID=3098149 RepID=A0ABU5HZQ2_9HYPH|nr:WD40 repeat domain-containing protein [Fulvimarina sp. 2208YS6-2-32]MDY8108342.1 WD40 repeat domain-containing protein [Fulvimarina sp. 2208YS6-2-32]
MPSIAPYDLGEFVERAVFLDDAPLFALADGTVHMPLSGAGSVLTAHDGGLLTASLDRFANRLLTGGEDGKVMAIDGQGRVTEIASIGRKWVSTVAGGPNDVVGFGSGRTAYTRMTDGTVREEVFSRTVEGIAFAPKGLRAAVARYDGASLYFPATDAEPIFMEWKGAHIGVTFSPDGRFLVTTMQENALHGWRLSDGKHMRMTGYPAKVKDWSWSAKNRFLATSGAPAAILWPFSGKDGPMGKAPLELGTRGDTMVTSVACHPAEDMLAIGYQDGMILAVRFQDSKEALLRRGGTAPVRTLAWDKAGRRLAFGSEAGEAGLVDIAG